MKKVTGIFDGKEFMHKLGLDFFGAGSIEKSRRIVSKLRDFTFRIANFGEEFGTENEKESVFKTRIPGNTWSSSEAT